MRSPGTASSTCVHSGRGADGWGLPVSDLDHPSHMLALEWVLGRATSTREAVTYEQLASQPTLERLLEERFEEEAGLRPRLACRVHKSQ